MNRRKQESLRFDNLFWSLWTQSGLLTYAKLIVLSKRSFSKSWGIVTCKGIQNSLGFRIPRHGFRIPGTGFRILCERNLDSGFQSLEGLRIPWDVYSLFQSLGSRIIQGKISPIPESGISFWGERYLHPTQENILCSKLSTNVWTLHNKIFWKKLN